jgi:hypothetical protein
VSVLEPAWTRQVPSGQAVSVCSWCCSAPVQVLAGRYGPLPSRYSLDLSRLVNAMLRPNPAEVGIPRCPPRVCLLTLGRCVLRSCAGNVANQMKRSVLCLAWLG